MLGFDMDHPFQASNRRSLMSPILINLFKYPPRKRKKKKKRGLLLDIKTRERSKSKNENYGWSYPNCSEKAMGQIC